MDIEETFDNEGIRKGGIITLDGIEIKLGNIGRVSWNVGARKLLDIVLTRITKLLPYDNPTPENIVKIFGVKITLDEYMQICGLKDRRNAKEQFRAAAEALTNIYLKFDYLKYFSNRRKKPVLVHFNYHLFEGFDETRTLNVDPIVHSEINFDMSIRVLEYLGARRLSPLNFKIFLINSHKHPHAYNMARKLYEHYNLNVDKGPVRLSVASLREACPDLPRNEEVQGRHHRQLILEPFDRDLSALCDIYELVNWHYCNAGGEPITDEQLANFDFEDWENWLIEFTLPDYPPREAPQKRGRPGKTKILAL